MPAGTIEKWKADLRSSSTTTRREAGDALGSIPGPTGIEALMSVFGDSDYLVGHDAAESLGMTGRRDAVPPLLRAIQDPLVRVRQQAAAALFTLAARDVSDPAELDILTAALKDDEVVAVLAAMTLGQLRDVRAFQALAEAYRSGNRGAPDALAMLKDDRALELLLADLRNSDDDRRGQAAGALGRAADPRAVRGLCPVLGDPDAQVRTFAAIGLDQLASDGVTDPCEHAPLVGALKDPEHGVRLYAARALGHIGERRALRPLQAAATRKGEEQDVLSAMQEAIESIKRKGAKRAAQTGAVP